MNNRCPFCDFSTDRVSLRCGTALALRDAFPVSPGHSLVIPQRHICSLFETTEQERSDLFMVLDQTKNALEKELQPNGFNIGINDGQAAGQTVFHLHIHLIPRFTGDSPDPRGGVRWIFPRKARYWKD